MVQGVLETSALFELVAVAVKAAGVLVELGATGIAHCLHSARSTGENIVVLQRRVIADKRRKEERTTEARSG